MSKNIKIFTIGLIGIILLIITGCQCNDLKLTMDSFKSGSKSNKSGTRQLRDTKRPYIKLIGPEVIYIEQGGRYVEPGYIARDNKDGNISKKVIISGEVNENILGLYILTYYVKDNAGNWAKPKYRRINIIKPRVKM